MDLISALKEIDAQIEDRLTEFREEYVADRDDAAIVNDVRGDIELQSQIRTVLNNENLQNWIPAIQ